MTRYVIFLLLMLCGFSGLQAQPSQPTQGQIQELRIVSTTDVHGSFFPIDFMTGKPASGSMARVSSYVNRLRHSYGDRLILLDNGDILQGQPISYFSNYLDTLQCNIAGEVVNYLCYDAQNLGNHDIEPGHAVYDKWIGEVDCPTLGANVIDVATGMPYVKPYVMLNRGGVKVAVLGLLTPAIPHWLAPDVWRGLKFQEMVLSARYWVDFLKRNEHPDVIVGLFHSGYKGGIVAEGYRENAAREVAQQVEGFDIIVFGHDHTRHNGYEMSPGGKQVLLLNGANAAQAVGDAVVKLEYDGKKWHIISSEGMLTDVTQCDVDENYMNYFQPFIDKAQRWISQPIGEIAHTITTRDCFFGNSAFNDLILNLELEITHADVAFSAPLGTDLKLEKGKITMGDMFSLYKFENQLYVMNMTGEEIRRHLEMSYGMWCNTMTSASDHLILMKKDGGKMQFAGRTYNFDSAAGIDYEVDVTQPVGSRVKILQMSNGSPFVATQVYKVAMSSYRANGGGELLTRGAGIARDQLASRIVYQSDLDLRHYLAQAIQRKRLINPAPNHNWRFVPEKWTKAAAQRDYRLLFK